MGELKKEGWVDGERGSYSRSLFYLVWSWDFELVAGAGVPVGRGHSGKREVRGFLEVAFFVHEAIADVDVVDDPDDEAIGSDFEGGVLGAFESNGGFGDARDLDFLRGKGGEFGVLEFALAVRKGGGGVDHDLAERFIDHVDDEFLVLADVASSVLGGVAVFVARSEGDDGRI